MQNLTKNPALGEREEGTLEGEGGGGWRVDSEMAEHSCVSL